MMDNRQKERKKRMDGMYLYIIEEEKNNCDYEQSHSLVI